MLLSLYLTIKNFRGKGHLTLECVPPIYQIIGEIFSLTCWYKFFNQAVGWSMRGGSSSVVTLVNFVSV